MHISRRESFLLTAGLLAAGCSPQANGDTGAGEYGRPGDMALGPADAQLTLVEYASVTCPHCKVFHDTVWPTIRKDYIDTGRIRYVFREFPTAMPEVATAGFLIARCGDVAAERYFDRLDVLFKQQETILKAAQRGAAREPLLQIAQQAGLSEAQFERCVRDEAAIARIQAGATDASKSYGVSGTPTLVLNGERLTSPEYYTLDGLRALLDERLAAQ